MRESLLYNSHLQKHKNRDLRIRPTLRHMSYCTQGETEKAFQGLGRFEREVEPVPPVPQARELYFSLHCSPRPADIYLQEEDSNECNGEGDHHFGIFLCWQLLQGWQKALWKEVEGLSQALVPFPRVT